MSSRFIVVFITACFASSCATQEQTADRKNMTTPDSTTTLVKTTAKVGPLSSTLNEYYKLKDAFVRTDGTSADMAAMQLRLSVDSIDTDKLGADSADRVAVTNNKKAMLLSIDGIIKERDLQKKRMQFAQLSDNLYSFIKATPYAGETIYQVHCPMAFDKGANWLNNQPVVANPYFGSKMMECGEVTDSLTGK